MANATQNPMPGTLPETLGIPGNVYPEDMLFNNYKPSSFHDGIATLIKPNFSGLGSLAHYFWNKPRTGSQPPAYYPLHMARWNEMAPTSNWTGRNIPAPQMGAYLVQVKTYGRSMDFESTALASLKG